LAAERLLVDTHVLLWYFEGRDKLAQRRVRLLDAALEAAALHGSVLSVFELGSLARRGRLRQKLDLGVWFRQAAALGLTLLPVDADVAFEASRVPGDMLPDPFDQLLVATALVHGLTLVTRDGAMLDFGAQGHVRTLEI